MVEREYFDHVTPEGTCAKDMQLEFDFEKNEELWENIVSAWTSSNSGITKSRHGTILDLTKLWFDSRGHRYTLLYPDHKAGAIACYEYVCTYFGLYEKDKDYDAVKSGRCTKGADGLASWRTAPPQEHEVPWIS